MEKKVRMTKREINRYNEHIVVEMPTKEIFMGTLVGAAVCAAAGCISYIAIGLIIL